MERYNWQAPGNSRIFDSKLNMQDSKYITSRTIMVMKFFSKKWIEWNSDLPKKLDLFLKENFLEYRINDSIKTHFFKPLLFFGLLTNVKNNKGDFLLLSMDGRKILDYLESHDYDSALKHFLLSTLWTSYPNIATPKTKLIKNGLFPFRILYSLLKKEQSLTLNEIVTKVIFINDIEDLKEYDKFKKNFYFDKTKFKNVTDHFRSWVIESLVDIGIFLKKRNLIFLSEEAINIINEENIDLDNYEKFFFRLDDSTSYIDSKWNYTKFDNEDFPKRSRKLAKEILEQSNYLCFLESTHKTFYTVEGTNYMEAHHIIPFSLGKIIEEKNNIDIKENLISLCPNCHRAMHYSENATKIKMLDKIWTCKEKELIDLNYTKNDLYQIYLDNIYLGSINKKKRAKHF